MSFFGGAAVVMLIALAVLVWADTAQVIYTAKRLDYHCQRHRVLLRSHHYVLAAVAISTKAFFPALVLGFIALYTSWLATWMVDGALVTMLYYRAKVVEKNQERIDSLRWHNTLLERGDER